MARLFDNAASEYLRNAVSAPATAAPLSMVAWFNSDEEGAGGYWCIIQIQDKDVSNEYFNITIRVSGGGNHETWAVARDAAGTNYSSEGGDIWGANAWHHGAGVFIANNSRYAYTDGTQGVHNAVARTPAAVDSVDIGRQGDSSPSIYFSGGIAEAAVYVNDLSATEVGILADGYSPLFVQPENLVAYWPLIRDDNDWVGDFNMTAFNGPSWMDHPEQTFKPSRPFIHHGEAVTTTTTTTSTTTTSTTSTTTTSTTSTTTTSTTTTSTTTTSTTSTTTTSTTSTTTTSTTSTTTTTVSTTTVSTTTTTTLPPIHVGVGRVFDVMDYSGGREEMIEWWTSYYQTVVGYDAGRAKLAALEMVADIMEDDEEFFALL